MILKRVSSLALCLALSLMLCVHAAAAERSANVVVDGKTAAANATIEVIDQNTYVAYWTVVKAMYPNATASWENGQSVARASGLTLCVKPGAKYIVANGRYLYVAGGVRQNNGNMMVPAWVLAKALGAKSGWDEATQSVCFQSGTGPIASGDRFYNADDLYWLSRIIYAESGNQSLAGKIGVGNVILNRVKDSRFPSTVKGVIFQSGQFSPVRSGSIYRTPSEESVIAAKLCLEGVNTTGKSLYFINPSVSPNSWASRNRTCVATIGAHAFYA
ncbi:cell wall hydrolase [Pseudoflavonifractor sp. MSJ-37]|uniref:cell wall hydrolase n=1 Tax=Pseudoflavonifractor sp. MSJ-37 TaxID=2841531 RepID=UPI00209EB717|nr:cell wall hydrolase [Pseudoflavonifractor sp. MSJ-37]